MPGVRDGAGSCKVAIPCLTIREVADVLYDGWFQREWQAISVPILLESAGVPPAALSRSKVGLTAHWHLWKASGYGRWHGLWARTSPHVGATWQPCCGNRPRCSCHPVGWTAAQNRAGTVFDRPSDQSWVAIWYPPPLKLCIRFCHLRKSMSPICYRTKNRKPYNV